MKIHIVQKGDTLWEIAKNYGVDFDQLKQMNPQLSSPDMIMPGMKIKIPSTSKPVKKETMEMKETQKPKTQQPYKDTSPKPIPVVKEDDEKKPKSVQPKMPMQPKMQPKMQPMMQMPTMEQEMNNYTTINFPEMPPYPGPEEEPEKMQYMPMQQPMIPVYCFCPPPPMHHAVPNAMGKKDCGCGGPQPMVSPMQSNQMPMAGPMQSNQMPMVGPAQNNQMPMQSPMQYPNQYPSQYPNQYSYQGPMPTNNPYHYGNMESIESSPSMDMPVKPAQSPYMNNYSPLDAQVPPQTMGAQQGFHSPNMPPQSHPYFANATNNNMPYPSPPGFDENSMFDFREDEDEDNSKSE